MADDVFLAPDPPDLDDPPDPPERDFPASLLLAPLVLLFAVVPLLLGPVLVLFLLRAVLVPGRVVVLLFFVPAVLPDRWWSR